MTKQSDAEQVDINRHLARWIAHGPHPALKERPKYGDFSAVGDYLDSWNKVARAQLEFDALPSKIRKYCDNDVGKFVDLVYDPTRRGELEELGLLEEQAPAAAPPSVEPVAAEAALSGSGEDNSAS